jgi:hypothetical protein
MPQSVGYKYPDVMVWMERVESRESYKTSA